jgi:dipeptidyl aminopeptidase/acylaminoacyl peptidase
MLGRLIASIALVFALATSSAAQSAARPTPEQFATAATFISASLSPSGRYVAGIKQIGANDQLLIIDLQTKSATNIQRGNYEQGSQIEWVQWKSEDQLLFGAIYKRTLTTQRRETGTRMGRDRTVRDFWIARVMSTPRAGGVATPMFEGETNRLGSRFNSTVLINMLPNDPANILIAAYGTNGLALWRANVSTGSVAKVDEGMSDTAGWETDINGAPVLRVDVLPRNSGLRYLRRAPGARDWTKFLDLVGNDAANSSEFQPIAPAASPGEVYVAARRDGADRASVYTFNAATGAFGPALLSHPVADFSSVGIVDYKTGALLGACVDVQRLECVSNDPVTSRYIRAIDNFFERSARVTVSEMSNDQKIWLLRVEEQATPPAYFIFERDASRIYPLVGTRENVEDASFGETTVVRYKGRDGTDLWGYLTNGPAQGAAPKALIVMPHGGPESRDRSGFDAWAQFLATRGYAVFQPNFRGGGGFGRAFIEAGHGQWGLRMQDDVTDGVKHLIAAGAVDPARVCIFGWSYGGYAALAGGALTPEMYKCVIAGAGPSDLLDMLAWEKSEEGRGSMSYAYWTKAIGDPTANRDALIAASPRRHAAAFRAPVLLLHGDIDDIVPADQSRAMRDALRSAGKDVRFVEVQDEGHSPSLWEYENRVIFYKEIDAFLAQHLPAN